MFGDGLPGALRAKQNRRIMVQGVLCTRIAEAEEQKIHQLKAQPTAAVSRRALTPSEFRLSLLPIMCRSHTKRDVPPVAHKLKCRDCGRR